MNIFRQLTEKPWVPDPDGVVALRDGRVSGTPRARVGLKIFLAVVGVLFFLLTIAYAGRMAFEDWRPVPEPWLMWQNTFMLILASTIMLWTQIPLRWNQWDSAKLGFLMAGAFTFAFLVGQFLAWRQLATLGVFELTNPAIALFILITGLHGLHMLGGLVVWSRTINTIWPYGNGVEAPKARQSIELCTLYWHFMLVVWLVLFGLLFAGNDNLDFLLSLCGIK